MARTALKALAFNCTLKGVRDEGSSSTQALLEQVMEAFGEHGAHEGDKEYKDFKRPPKVVAGTTTMLVSNAVHLARRPTLIPEWIRAPTVRPNCRQGQLRAVVKQPNAKRNQPVTVLFDGQLNIL